CQYPSCRRVITGNVSFVCHLWAHIATWKEYDPKSPSFPILSDSSISTAPSKRNDVDILSTCRRCTLMCPFCTFTLVVPSYQRKRPVIRNLVWVVIIARLSFTNIADKQKHRRDHSAVNPKWTMTYRNPETRSRQRSRLVCQEQKPQYQCKQCVNNADGTASKKCIACVTLAFNESLYGKRRMATDTSVRRGIDALQCSQRGLRFHCQCGMRTRNGNRMAQHFYYCNKDFEVN
ncbi:hypothetical protein OSTOST_24615, partial [Ostertagia ostertagi]